MSDVIRELNEKMMYFFEEISKIPRGSKNEKRVSDYIVQFAKDRNLEVDHQQEMADHIPINNVVIRKPGTAGYENCDPVVLQGHMDMVCQKAPGVIHDFTTDPIELDYDGDKLKAKGTTLGADDGIGDACMMAILDSNSIAHPPLEAVFTSDEEDGMSGAREFQKDLLKGRTFINIDAETEGLFYYGCAGGIYAKTKFTFEPVPSSACKSFFKITISGLKGGHSGLEINKNHANGIRLIARTFDMLSQSGTLKLYLAEIGGGTFPNAIPVSAYAVVGADLTGDGDVSDELNRCLEQIKDIFVHEYGVVEDQLSLAAERLQDGFPNSFVPSEVAKNLVTALLLMPNDVLAMSNKVEGLVETSSNLGLIRQESNTVLLTSFIRSSVETRKAFTVEQMKLLAEGLGASFSSDTDCPAWEPDPDSGILKLFKETYKDLYQTEPITESVHAGLECGYFAKHFPDMDLIACGPTITGAHTPEETLYLDTTPKIMELIVNVLKNLK